MLKFGKDYDETKRVHMYLAGHIAENADGTIHMRRSQGHRRAGRPSKYYVRMPNEMVKQFTAFDDDEALEIANSMLAQRQAETVGVI